MLCQPEVCVSLNGGDDGKVVRRECCVSLPVCVECYVCGC